MKTINKLMALVGVAVALSASSVFAAYDGTLNFVSLGGGNANGGGVFNVTTIPNAGSQILGSFGTFCIEHNEFIGVPGGPYNYKIGLGAVNGGIAGGNPDMISIGTAWLYSQFRAGLLGVLSNQQKSDLQQAIWYLENESGALSVSGANGTAFYNAAKAGTSTTDATVFNNSGGAYNVVVLNLYNLDGTVAQDQLGLVPEATTMIAGALLLLPLGASALRIIRRNRKP